MKKTYHFIGIGGIGMSGLARILLQRGHHVCGSDIASSALIEKLQLEGAHIHIGHNANNLGSPDAVVHSTAIRSENPEVQSALEKKVPFLHRSDLLKELMEGYSPLLVAGMHGKTTTSSLLTHVLMEANLNPAYSIGGIVRNFSNNGGHGSGPFFVAEADESDGSFLKYQPFGTIITNMDNEHLDYWKTEEAIHKGFLAFAEKVESQEHFFWCGDQESLRALNLKGISYGFNEHNDLRIENFLQIGWKIVFDICFKEVRYSDIEIPLIGGHNVLNASAVFGLCLNLNISEEKIREAFKSFAGISRRMEKKGEAGGILFYDDYAHHPAEIYATLRAARQAIGQSKRLVVAFQPHRYTRTRDCMDEFAMAFESADEVILTDIYSAGEKPIDGITTETLCKKIEESSQIRPFYAPRAELASYLHAFLKPSDVFISLGAGNITNLSSEIIPLIKNETK